MRSLPVPGAPRASSIVLRRARAAAYDHDTASTALEVKDRVADPVNDPIKAPPSETASPCPTPPAAALTVGELAARTGVAPSALRFYEARGLLRAERTAADHRRYPRATARRVAFVVFAQRVGFTLEEIRAELARLPADRAPTRREWGRLSRTWHTRIDARIAELERLRTGLTGCIGCGCLSLERCAILNPDDRLARHGPGPRYWLGDARPDPSSPSHGEPAADDAPERPDAR